MDTEIDINFRKGLAISTEDTRAATKVAHSNHQNKAEFFQSLCPEYCPMQQWIMDLYENQWRFFSTEAASPSHGCEMTGNDKNKELYEKTGAEQ